MQFSITKFATMTPEIAHLSVNPVTPHVFKEELEETTLELAQFAISRT